MTSRILTAIAVFLLIISGAKPALDGSDFRSYASYVAVYSSVYHGDRQQSVDLAVTLSIHNVDLRNTITITAVDFYDTAGRKLKGFQDSPRPVNPLETVQFYIRESDTRGGAGANFIVRWRARSKTAQPLIESIMIGTKGQQGISFTSRGVLIPE